MFTLAEVVARVEAEYGPLRCGFSLVDVARRAGLIADPRPRVLRRRFDVADLAPGDN